MSFIIPRRRMLVLALMTSLVGTVANVYAQSPQSWDQVVAAAEKEGEVVVAGPVIQPYREALEGFRQAYPKIKLEFNAVTSPSFDARITSERRAGKHLTDVAVLGFSGATFSQQIPAGWFDPINPFIVSPDVLDDTKWLGGFKAGFLDTKKQYLYAFQAGKQNNLNIDRAAVPLSEFSKLEDLLNPKWKGKIAILDPRERGSGHLITLLLTALGPEQARKFLVEQKPVIASSNRQLADWVAQGAYPITSGLSPSEVAALQEQGLAKSVEALKTLPSETAWTPGWGVIALLNQPPHPNAAKVFINWVLSQPAQTEWARKGFVNSRRTDVKSGLAASALSGEEYVKGVSFNTEAQAEAALQAVNLAKKELQ